MKKRLTSIVTRRGDKGHTSLGDGSSVAKNSDRINALGTVDELNSFIGLFLSELTDSSKLFEPFRAIQNDLFDLGGELAMPGYQLIQQAHWEKLEALVEQLNQDLPPLENFILPGGSKTVSLCHVVRSQTRRAERNLVALADTEGEEVNQDSRIYLNRLSDLCFVSARWLARDNGEDEVLWQQSPMEKSPTQKNSE